MPLEQAGPAHVALDSPDPLVPAHLRHLQSIGVKGGGIISSLGARGTYVAILRRNDIAKSSRLPGHVRQGPDTGCGQVLTPPCP